MQKVREFLMFVFKYYPIIKIFYLYSWNHFYPIVHKFYKKKSEFKLISKILSMIHMTNKFDDFCWDKIMQISITDYGRKLLMN